MANTPLQQETRGHISRLILDLLKCGWTLEAVPSHGRVPRNGLQLELKAGNLDVRLRVYVYKVTSSGRSRSHESRVEITTTYPGGLRKLKGFRDVVLGFDEESNTYVGIDMRRLRMGGRTHNASSFFDREGLSVSRGAMLVNPRRV